MDGRWKNCRRGPKGAAARDHHGVHIPYAARRNRARRVSRARSSHRADAIAQAWIALEDRASWVTSRAFLPHRRVSPSSAVDGQVRGRPSRWPRRASRSPCWSTRRRSAAARDAYPQRVGARQWTASADRRLRPDGSSLLWFMAPIAVAALFRRLPLTIRAFARWLGGPSRRRVARPRSVHLAGGVAFARGLDVAERIAVFADFRRLARAGFRCPREATVAEYFAGTPRAHSPRSGHRCVSLRSTRHRKRHPHRSSPTCCVRH